MLIIIGEAPSDHLTRSHIHPLHLFPFLAPHPFTAPLRIAHRARETGTPDNVNSCLVTVNKTLERASTGC